MCPPADAALRPCESHHPVRLGERGRDRLLDHHVGAPAMSSSATSAWETVGEATTTAGRPGVEKLADRAAPDHPCAPCAASMAAALASSGSTKPTGSDPGIA